MEKENTQIEKKKIDINDFLIDEPRNSRQVAKIVGSNARTLYAFVWTNRVKNENHKNKKTMILYRMLRHLPQEIIDFFSDDNNFDAIYCNLEKYNKYNVNTCRGRKPYRHIDKKRDYANKYKRKMIYFAEKASENDAKGK